MSRDVAGVGDIDMLSEWSFGKGNEVAGMPAHSAAASSPAVPVKQPPEEDDPTYATGDQIQVWSNSKKAWVEGVVLAIYTRNQVADGYSVVAGTIKVTSGAGVKWLLPDLVKTQLRKAPAARGSAGYPSGGSSPARPVGYDTPGPPAPPPGGTGSRRGAVCKNGCGRPVQPGFTRGLKLYDTCCKRCAQHNGAKGHDENCGKLRKVGIVKLGEESGDAADIPHKKVLDTMLTSTEKLSEHVNSIFNYLGKGSDKIDKDQVGPGLQELMSMFGIKQEIRSVYLTEVCRRAGIGNTLGVPDFFGLCKMALEDLRTLWFPETLPLVTKYFVKKNRASLQDVYTIGRQLGQGSFGVVYEVKHKISGEVRVCKMIAKSSPGMDYRQIMQEIHNMAMLDHPNVIKVYEYFEDDKHVIQIMEQCKGGELQEKVDEVRRTGKGSFDEAFICDVMKQTLRALAFMHGIKCLHKDLKPQNIMLVDRKSASVKVIDFGLAELFKDSQEYARSIGGTLLYMAPEVFQKEMTTKVDVWSCGVILFNLMTGDFPYMAKWPPPEGKDQKWWQEQTIEKIKRASTPQNPRLKHFSPHCVDLLQSMLRSDVNSRPDAAQCLEHPWFQVLTEAPTTLSVGVVQCVEAYARMNELKKAFFLYIAHQRGLDDVPELRALFTHFDYRNRGTLSSEDLYQVLVECGIGGLRAERVLHVLDRASDGQIRWTEFIAAAICVSVCRNQAAVDLAFTACDTDHDGKIMAEDILKIIAPPDSAGQHAWKRRLPDLFNELTKEDSAQPKIKSNTSTMSSFGLGRLAASLFPSSSSSKESPKVDLQQFRTYMGKTLTFRAGDGLFAVT